MFDTLLPTKLYQPPLRPDWIARPRLMTPFQITPTTKMILVSAPAGYGKTTLVTAWLQSLKDVPICWLSLAEEDSDPQVFFSYLSTAVGNLPQVQNSLPQYLQANQPIPTPTLMHAFIHDITAVSTPFVLIFDDYHALNAPEIDKALATLLEHMPPQMTLIITSRSDPGIPLARLRTRNQLIELRAADLRFSEAEAAQFLRQTMGLSLTPAQISALETRTEGWVAGLQMAALSLQKRSQADADTFVQNFAGTHRFVLDYLLEETLQQQTPVVRDFLLATSILDRLSGSLCTAVSQIPHAQQILETLERDNLFVVPLDDKRHSYRYHHLFADVLKAHALAEQPTQVAIWHQRACHWYVAQNDLPHAIHHALTAQDWPTVAHLLELIRPQIDGTYQIKRWLRWAQSLPTEFVTPRPTLVVGYGWALLENGQLAEGAACLQAVAQCLETADSDPQDALGSQEVLVADEATALFLPASLDAAWAYHALAVGEVNTAVFHAQRVLDFCANPAHQAHQDHQWHRAALSILGLIYWLTGDLDGAIQAFGSVTQSTLRSNKLVDALSTAYIRAEIQIAQGFLHQAAATLEGILPFVLAQEALPPLGSSDLYRLLALLAWEWGDENTAVAHLQTAQQLGQQATLINGTHRLLYTQAEFKQGQGDLAGALALLEQADAQYVENPVPVVRSVAAYKARLWLAQGELDKARAWADAHHLTVHDELSYLREFEYLTLARLRVAQYSQQRENTAVLNEALTLLNRLEQAANAGNRPRSIIEVHLLQALAHATHGDHPTAHATLHHALTLAEPQGYIRLFLNEGVPLLNLLTQLSRPNKSKADNRLAAYIQQLCAAFAAHGLAAHATASLIDPLSERELEILALIVAGLKNKEIAAQLMISLNTVLYHTKNIYGKLGVNKRTLAVAKAHELNLLQDHT